MHVCTNRKQAKRVGAGLCVCRFVGGVHCRVAAGTAADVHTHPTMSCCRLMGRFLWISGLLGVDLASW